MPEENVSLIPWAILNDWRHRTVERQTDHSVNSLAVSKSRNKQVIITVLKKMMPFSHLKKLLRTMLHTYKQVCTSRYRHLHISMCVNCVYIIYMCVCCVCVYAQLHMFVYMWH